MTPRRAFCLCLVLSFLLFSSYGAAYWVQLSNNDLDPQSSPEQYRPAADGTRPGPGAPPLPVEIEVLPLPIAMPEGSREAIKEAVNTWDQVRGSAMDVSVSFREGDYDHSFSSRLSDPDGRNTIEFVPADWPHGWGSNVICMTVPKLDQGRIVEADMFCNAEHYRWMVFPYHGSFPDLVSHKRVDVEALVSHEMGHMLGLGHSQYSWAAMFFLPGIADTRCRRLSGDDKEGLRHLYPATAADEGPPSIWGVHHDNFSDTRCGLDSHITTRISAQHYYERRLALSTPPSAGNTVVEYCLFGSGFAGSTLSDMDVVEDGVLLDAATAHQYVSPNFAKAKIMNGADGYPVLPAGGYDLSASNTGGRGLLFQGLLINEKGNELPEAVIVAGRTLSEPARSVKLSGRDSFDPDGGTLSYEWSVAVKPPQAAGVLSSSTAAQTSAYLESPGLYVIRLVVNDGIADSIADQVIIRAEYGAFPPEDDEDYSPYGCSVARGENNVSLSGLLPLLVPLLVFLLFKKAIKRTAMRC